MGTCLAAYVFYKPGRFLVWTMKKETEQEEPKWEKLITFSLSSPEFGWVWTIRPMWFTKDGKVVLFMQGSQKQPKFLMYDLQTKRMDVRISGIENYNSTLLKREAAATNIESLVSPNMFGCHTQG